MTENLVRKTFYRIVQIIADGMAVEAKKGVSTVLNPIPFLIFDKKQSILYKLLIMNISALRLSTKYLVPLVLLVISVCYGQQSALSQTINGQTPWEPVGLSGGGGMFSPAISPADPNMMMLNCDMSSIHLRGWWP